MTETDHEIEAIAKALATKWLSKPEHAEARGRVIENLKVVLIGARDRIHNYDPTTPGHKAWLKAHRAQQRRRLPRPL